MSSVMRRGGSALARILERASDPGGTANEVQLYVKDVSGTAQLFAQDGAGTVHQMTPVASANELVSELWTQNNVAASQSNVDLSAQVSQLFDTWVAIRAGSIIGMATRFSEAITDATADSALVTVTVGGVGGTLQVSHSSGTNPSGGEATQAAGTDTFVAGDTLGFEITTLGTFAPTTTDVEAEMEIVIS